MWVQSGCGAGLELCLPIFIVSSGGRWAGLRAQDLPDAGGGPLAVCSLPFIRSLALPLVHCLQIWLYFAFFRGFQRVLGCLCGFVLSWCFAWLVGLLYACGVRRIKGLLRVCLRFSYSLSFYLCVCSAFISVPIFWALPLLLSACPLCLLCLSLWPCGLCCCFFFPFGYMRKKKGRNSLRPLLSCCGLYYLVAALYSSYSSGVSPFIS